MKGFVLGLAAGLVVATAAAGNAVPRMGSQVSECSGVAPRVCNLRSGTAYEVDIRALDLGCTYFLQDKTYGVSRFLSCSRLSNQGQCVDGHPDSLTAYITNYVMYLGFPSTCLIDLNAKPLGYRITRVGGNTRQYNRDP